MGYCSAMGIVWLQKLEVYCQQLSEELNAVKSTGSEKQEALDSLLVRAPSPIAPRKV